MGTLHWCMLRKKTWGARMFLRRGLLKPPFCLLGEYILGTLYCGGKNFAPRQLLALSPGAGVA